MLVDCAIADGGGVGWGELYVGDRTLLSAERIEELDAMLNVETLPSAPVCGTLCDPVERLMRSSSLAFWGERPQGKIRSSSTI